MWNVWLGLGLITGAGSAPNMQDEIRRIWGSRFEQAQREDEEVLAFAREFLDAVTG